MNIYKPNSPQVKIPVKMSSSQKISPPPSQQQQQNFKSTTTKSTKSTKSSKPLKNAESETKTLITLQPAQFQKFSSFNFPVDLVYTWVDGNDEELVKLRQNYVSTQPNVHQDSMASCRWRDFDELKYSIESSKAFAPWIRKIWIITDHQRPYWSDEKMWDNVEFIDHPIIFGEFDEHLPTFNSHSIECHLHNVPGLAEHFIYANDDTFFGSPCEISDFFTEDGKCKIFLSTYELPAEKINKEDTPYSAAQKNVYSIVSQFVRKPRQVLKKLKHQMKASRKQAFEYCWENEISQLYMFNTSSTRFRSLTDIDPLNLVSQMALLIGLAVPAIIQSKYYVFQDTEDVLKVFKHIYKWRPLPKIYCINDTLTNPTELQIQTIRRAFQKYLPHQFYFSQVSQQPTQNKSQRMKPNNEPFGSLKPF